MKAIFINRVSQEEVKKGLYFFPCHFLPGICSRDEADIVISVQGG